MFSLGCNSPTATTNDDASIDGALDDARYEDSSFHDGGVDSGFRLGYEDGEEKSGGETTVDDISTEAFGYSARNLTPEQRGDFAVGNSFFRDNWVVAPSSTSGRDGVGPLLNARSCSTCHFKDGRGRLPEDGLEMSSALVRVSLPGVNEHGGPNPLPAYGDQLQPRAIAGVDGEVATRIEWDTMRGTYADGTAYELRKPRVVFDSYNYGPFPEGTMQSLRVAPSVFGLGLIEALDAETLLAYADPDDENGDGISGRANYVWNRDTSAMSIGRFGWKSNQPSIRQQTADAFANDMGITSSLAPQDACMPQQAMCLLAPNGGEPEIADGLFAFVVFYGQTLAVPARRDVRDEQVLRGKDLFHDAGCANCHRPQMQTGTHPVTQLSNQRIYPYSDFLLHDLGDGLADGRPDFAANGNEWRTAPLWGLGLVQTVNRHDNLLHDGRARGVEEAILWHDGEARNASQNFRQMTATERADLVRFVRSL